MFSCKRCGICCTNIGGRFSEEESKMIEQAFKRLEFLGLKLLISPRKFTLPLFKDEVDRLKKLSEFMGIEFKPVPKLALLNGNKLEILEWDLNSRICPFYDEGCVVYRYRPLACRSFPVIRKMNSYELLDLCPEARKVHVRSDTDIRKAFPEECRNADIFFNRINEIKKALARRLEDGVAKEYFKIEFQEKHL